MDYNSIFLKHKLFQGFKKSLFSVCSLGVQVYIDLGFLSIFRLNC